MVKRCTNPGCTELVTKQHMEDHLKTQCNYRLKSCDHCKEPISLAEHEVSKLDLAVRTIAVPLERRNKNFYIILEKQRTCFYLK